MQAAGSGNIDAGRRQRIDRRTSHACSSLVNFESRNGMCPLYLPRDTIMACIVMTDTVMAYIAMAYIVMTQNRMCPLYMRVRARAYVCESASGCA